MTVKEFRNKLLGAFTSITTPMVTAGVSATESIEKLDTKQIKLVAIDPRDGHPCVIDIEDIKVLDVIGIYGGSKISEQMICISPNGISLKYHTFIHNKP